MSSYRFVTRDHVSQADELLGAISLSDDAIACEFGAHIIRDLIKEAPSRHAGWTLEIADGERAVATIPFTPDAVEEFKLTVQC